MTQTLSVRLPDDIAFPLNKLCEVIERPKTFIIKKALENYLNEYADYQVALDRLNDKDDEIISSKDLRLSLGI